MKKSGLIFIIAMFVFTGKVLIADSPVTSTDFYKAYLQIEQVQQAEQHGILDGHLAGYLLDETVSIDKKAAVINALAVKEKVKNNAVTFKMFLARKYGATHKELNLDLLNGDELFCLGYLTVADDYSNAGEALPILERAKEKNAKSYTVNIIFALTQAQIYVDNSDKCSAWTVCDKVRNDASLNQDLNQVAIDIIFGHIDKYKEKCK